MCSIFNVVFVIIVSFVLFDPSPNVVFHHWEVIKIKTAEVLILRTGERNIRLIPKMNNRQLKCKYNETINCKLSISADTTA